MIFAAKMAARELRASWRRLVLFFVCVAIGVGAIVTLRSVIQSVRDVLTQEAKALMAADVVVRSNRPWSDNARRAVESRLAEDPSVEASETVELVTMVRPEDETKVAARTVELRAVEDGFPYYGEVELEDGYRYTHFLLQGRGVLVRPELLTQLDVRVSDQIVIGTETFTITGVIANEPGRRLGMFSFGPRVIIHLDDLEKTGLLVTGSRARYRFLFRVPEVGFESLVANLRQDFREDFVRVRTYRRREDRIGSDLERAENYLSLVGFVILVLGGIGVWSVTRAFIQQKLKSISVLKCLGAGTAQIVTIYVIQVLVLGVAGSLLGVAIAAGVIAAVPPSAVAALGSISYGLTWSAVLQGVGIGMMVSLLFSLVPLLEVRHVKPLLLLRHETARVSAVDVRRPGWSRLAWRRVARVDWTRLAAIVAVTAALLAIASWQAGSLRAGLFVCGGFVGVALVLNAAGALLIRLMAPMATTRWFSLRHAVMSLTRPGNQTRVILLAVGLGSFFIIGVRVLQANLLTELDLERRSGGADMFLIDIQQDQLQPMRTLLAQRSERPATLIPVLRARVTGVSGREVNLEGLEDVRGQGSLGRDYTVTYRNHLEENEDVLEGRFWGNDQAPPEPEVSIEESLQERFNINVGDVMRFDILSREVAVRVTSIRRVDWSDSRSGGFMFVFRPEALADAPHTYVALLKAPSDPGGRARLQRDLATGYPNVSAIDVREVLRTVEGVIANVTLAISIVGAVALFSGTLILVGAIAMTKFQRVREAAIFKTLGANTQTIAAMLALEYGGLGVLAGIIGSLGAVILSWALSRYLLDIPWHFAAGENLGGIVVTALLVGLVGVVSSLDVLRRKPLATLRAE